MEGVVVFMKKMQRVSKGIGIVLTVLLLFLTGGCAEYNTGNPADTAAELQGKETGSSEVEVSAFSDELIVRFLDVGQGNATLLQQGDAFILIDGGDREYSSFVVSYLKKLGVEKLEYVIVSHYDADHLNGVIGVLNAFACNRVLAPDYETDTKIYQSFLEIVKEKNITVEYPEYDDTYTFGKSTIRVVGPVSYGYAEGNSNSLGVRISYKDNSFLICGDCTQESEQDILYTGIDVESDVFVANHHGSRYSNCQEFLEAVNPKAVVISCGRNNSYKHPEATVLLEIQKLGANLYRTDLQGSITAVSDGSTITFENEACMDYRSGTELKSGADAGIKTEQESKSPTTRDEPIMDFNEEPTADSFVVNKNTKKFHLPDCSSVADMKDKNKEYMRETRADMIAQGYTACKRCNP